MVWRNAICIAKRYIADETSDKLDELLRTSTSLAVSVLCIPEIISALCRRRRERSLTNRQYESARAALEEDLADATVIAIIDEVVLASVTLLEAHPLRASDAIQRG